MRRSEERLRDSPYEKFREGPDDKVDRWRPESSVVLLREVDKLSISSPGMQRLSAGTC